MEAAGGRALAVQTDIRDEDQVERAVRAAVERFGGIDALVNNASAISLTGTLATPVKRFDLMMAVNVRGTFVASRACLPHLMEAANPHILTLAPPLNLDPRWLRDHVGYTIAKYGMSLCVLGMAEEFRAAGVAVNALWPRTLIATEALRLVPGADPAEGRTPEIVADAAWHVLTADSRRLTGRFLIDDEVLAAHGVTDLSGYAVRAGAEPRKDLFID
jgi:citronellol/citronellal dehydrogenase